MPLTAERDQLQLCGQLPKPLFVLYNQLSGYGTACDPAIKVSEWTSLITFESGLRTQDSPALKITRAEQNP